MANVTEQPWTVLRLLEWTTDFFKNRGSASPRLDAEVLLAHARQCERIELYAAFADVPDESTRVAFREMVRRRGGGTPVAYLVGHKEFYSLKFRVDDSTLIPRPETEHLVIEALDRIKRGFPLAGSDRPPRVIDLGTGTGIIAICLAKHSDEPEITAVDVEPAALELARWNARQHGVEERVEFIPSDWFAALPADAKYDLIVSNPPYVSESEYGELAEEVRSFEPKRALVADDEGTAAIGHLLGECECRLQPGGTVMIELSPMIAERCRQMAEQQPFLQNVHLKKDLAGHQRVLIADRTES